MAEAASGGVKDQFYRDDQNSDEETLHRIFNEISRILKMKEFDEDLKQSLRESFPNYLKTLDQRAEDLMRKDCAIVITGETSAGKSSIINLLLKADILPEGNKVTTTALCKIKHSDHRKILVYNRKGEQIGEEIPQEIDENKESEENSDSFRENVALDGDSLEKEEEILQNRPGNGTNPDSSSAELTNEDGHKSCEKTCNDTYSILERLFQSDPSVGVHSVEVCLPISILKGNIMIVDTPGVGDDDDLNEILKEYLPNAVGFVFVVEPSRGGGMQEDRILKVTREIQKSTDIMKCFNESDVIFAVNKWDTLYSRRGSEDPWVDVVKKIKEAWPHVNPNNIMKMSVREVMYSF